MRFQIDVDLKDKSQEEIDVWALPELKVDFTPWDGKLLSIKYKNNFDIYGYRVMFSLNTFLLFA